jgi:hypothetical protein
MVSAPAPPSSVSLPSLPIRMLAAALPMRISLKSDPATFSKPDSVSMPAPIVFCAVASARFTVTPAVAVAYDTVSLPAPPANTLLPLEPSSVSSNAEPVRFSMLASVSPSASPPVPVPVVRLTFTPEPEAA